MPLPQIVSAPPTPQLPARIPSQSHPAQSRSDRREAETCALLLEASDFPERRESLEQQAIVLNMTLARDLSSRYRGRGIADGDLEQVAYLGLVKAVRRYDATRGLGFIGFAVPTIRGEIRRHFRDAGWAVRPPRRIQELQSRIWASESALCQQLQRSPRPIDIANHLDVDVEDVVEALSTDGCFVAHSLDAPVFEDGDVVSDRLGGEDVEFDRTDARITLSGAVLRLSSRDRRILELRFFQGWTQQAIGAELGVTQMQVSRLLTRILRDLKLIIADAEPA